MKKLPVNCNLQPATLGSERGYSCPQQPRNVAPPPRLLSPAPAHRQPATCNLPPATLGCSPDRNASQPELPVSSPWLAHWFKWYARRYVARHFHSVRVARSGTCPANLPGPLVIYTNHASWWDPLICALLAESFFPERTSFAPIAAAALDKYRFFRKLGFFPVEQGSRRGAGQFLHTARAVLQTPDHILWLTPQGRFADVRQRPLRFQTGLAHLPRYLQRGCFLPLAIEYAFWEEQSPEVLVRFGEPVPVCLGQSTPLATKDWTELFERRLQQAQEDLASGVIRRDPAEFECLLRGRAGVGGLYDRWRRARAWLRGVPFQLEHGTA